MPENDQFILKPIPHKEAIEFIRNKPVMTRRVFDKLEPKLKCLAFTITGIESMDVLEKVRNIIAELPKGKSWDECKSQVQEELGKYMTEKTSRTRAELLMRMHGLTAFRVAQWELAQETKAALPYFKYVATMDNRTRASHKALHGLVLPVDDPFWDDHMPPGWDWMCRCQVVQISEEEKLEQEEAEKKIPLERRRVLNETQKKELRLNKRLTTGPSSYVDVRSAFERNGGASSLKDLRMSPEDVLKRYSKKTKEDFLNKLGGEYVGGLDGTYTVRDWFEGKKQPVTLKSLSVSEKISALKKILDENQDLLQEELNKKFMEVLELPMANRGKLTVDFASRISSGEREIFEEEILELEKFIGKGLLIKIPTVKVKQASFARSFYSCGLKLIQIDVPQSANKLASLRDVLCKKHIFAHELCHFIEDKFPQVKEKSVKFLKKRSGNEIAKSLKKLTNLKYRKDEIAFEDSWVAKGGDVYSGKYYTDPQLGDYFATEVLSMGIQRFLTSPARFFRQDPEYFEFVLMQLQGK